ncbi:hypothetical protein CL614_03825 [archaeon]|nr:hypothetical protein [archaeon]|tara:strand:- start:1760 stop:2197 length:438 start_codon:yes stop_codon:yes gene_type:complete
MQTLRKGKETYTELYPKAIEMSKKGKNVKDIAKELGISYSAVYAWLKQGRKPSSPSLVKFKKYLETHGPTASIDIKKVIPKHNDFYHIAQKRGIGIKRAVMDKRYADYRVWYYLDGQDDVLQQRMQELRKKYVKVKKKMMKTLGM